MTTSLSRTLLVALCSIVWLAAGALAQDSGPGVLGEYLKVGERVQAEIVVVVTPDELGPIVSKVDIAAAKDPEWFTEHAKKTASDVPLGYHEKLGLTREEYDTYIELWKQRKMERVEAVSVELKQGRKGLWKVVVTGSGLPIRLLSYDAESDSWTSPNGKLERIEDISAAASSILGEWKGKEWRQEKETPFGRTKTNFAIGRLAKGDYGLIVYRYQEVGTAGRRYDQSVLVRFKPVLPAN